MNVAVPWCQHSPMFGQRASSQTVFRPSPRISALSSRYFGEPGARTFSQDGFGVRGSGVDAAGVSGMIVGIAEPDQSYQRFASRRPAAPSRAGRQRVAEVARSGARRR